MNTPHTSPNPGARQLCTLLAIAGLITLLVSGVAGADVGVSIGPGNVTVAEPIPAGEEAPLPAFELVNPGDQPTTYRIVAKGLKDTSATAADPSWLTIAPATIDLSPGESAEVAVTVKPGAEAAGGRHAALVQAEIVPGDDATQIVAAAAARVFFDVSPSHGNEQIWLGWWILLLVALVAVAVAVWLIRRRTVLRAG